MTATKTLIAATMAAVAVAVGCGDDEPEGPSKADFIARADAICQPENARLEHAFEELFGRVGERGPTTKQAQRFIRANVPPYRAATEEWTALEPPADDADEIGAIAAAYQDDITAIERGLEDAGAAKATLTGNPTAAADLLARKYGFEQCGRE